MSLKSLISFASTLTETPYQNGLTVKQHVVFPVKTHSEHITVSSTEPFYVNFYATFEDNKKHTVSVIDTVLRLAKEIPLPVGVFSTEVTLEWPDEVFLALSEAPSNLMRVSKRYVFHDPTVGKVSGHESVHEISVVLFPNEGIKIFVEGDFVQFKKQVITTLRPDSATVEFSEEDSTALERKMSPWQRLIRAWKSRQSQAISLGFGHSSDGSLSFSYDFGDEDKDLTISELRDVEKKLKKSLSLTSSDESSLSSLNKRVASYKEGLEILKKAVVLLRSLELQVVFNQPLISLAQAKELVEQDIRVLREDYSRRQPPYQFNRYDRTKKLTELLSEHISSDTFQALESLGLEEFKQWLVAQGFNLVQLEELEDTALCKEHYLLEFFAQVFGENPLGLLEEYQASYVNLPPKFHVVTSTSFDAAELKSWEVPVPCCVVTNLQIHRSSFLDLSNPNSLQVGIMEDEKDVTQVSFALTLEGQSLFPLQEVVAEQFGFEFL